MAGYVGNVSVDRPGKTSNSSSGSSSETNSDEVRRLFHACDRDGDGFIDSQDLYVMCRQLNMEDSVDEIMTQLGVSCDSRISFSDFVRCRMKLTSEIEAEKRREERLMERRLASLSGHQLHEYSHGYADDVVSPGDPVRGITCGDSDNSLGVPPSSVDYDSGARDLGPEHPSLYRLVEKHEPTTYQHCQADATLAHLLDLTNSLHLAALTSLKGEIIEANQRLQQTLTEKDLLEKQLLKYQAEKLRIQREYQDRLEQQTTRYEDRITELHSVIAELQKKYDRHEINIIREEDEDEVEESDCIQSTHSGTDHPPDPHLTSIAEIGDEINAELSRVATELESAINESRFPDLGGESPDLENPGGENLDLGGENQDLETERILEQATELEHRLSGEYNDIELEHRLSGEYNDIDDLVPGRYNNTAKYDDKATQVYIEISDTSTDLSTMEPKLRKELESLRVSHVQLRNQIARQETDLNKMRAQRDSLREDRDRHKRRVRDLQTRVTGMESMMMSRPNPQSPNPHSPSRQSHRSDNEGSVAKVAELKKIQTWMSGQPELQTSDRPILGSELTTLGTPLHSKVAEQVTQSMKQSSTVQEITHSVNDRLTTDKIREFEIELESAQSQAENYKAQNELTMLHLNESKAHCDRLTVLMGKYESNHTAMQLCVNYWDQVVALYHCLITLLDSEVAILGANCRASGIASSGYHSDADMSCGDFPTDLQTAQASRRMAEHCARQLLSRLDKCVCSERLVSSPHPWEDFSTSHGTSTTSSNASSVDTEWQKCDEQKLRELVRQLMAECCMIKSTMMELETIHVDPLVQDSSPVERIKLDMESAILIQEIAAIKEEYSEMKAKNYMLEKEKNSMELQVISLSGKELAYQQHIKALCVADDKDDDVVVDIMMEKMKECDPDQLINHIKQLSVRELALKAQIKEFVSTLAYISQNSEYRHQQSATFVNDLKEANNALITAFEKSKKRYQAKLKKLETQLSSMKTKHEDEMGGLQHTICQLKSQLQPQASETSL